ncbi:MAG: class A beta-lactamase [Allosphingosinicella sp.]
MVSRRQIIEDSSRIARGAAIVGIAAIGLATAALAQGQPRGGTASATSFPSVVRGYTAPTPGVPAATSQEAAARRILEGQVRALGQAFNGDIGIAVRDVQSGWTTSYDGDTYFPQQSVSKFWVALAALDKADRGELNLGAPVTVRRGDMTLFHQPISAQLGAKGYNTTLDTLLYRAITQSDNTCNDFVMWKAGGPGAVRNFLDSRKIEGIRFGPGERLLQSRIAGMEWKQSYAYNGGFYKARAAVPASQRRAAFERYIKDPMDGATPNGIVEALARLKKGELLSPASTRKMLSMMGNTRTGPQRLKGGLSAGWKLAHKTGTGQVLGGEQAGYNDIGIVTGPDGRSYAVAVMIRRTSAPLAHRMAAMQNTVRAVISFDQNMTTYGMARYGAGADQGSR